MNNYDNVLPYSDNFPTSLVNEINKVYDGCDIWINQDKLNDPKTLSKISEEFLKISPIYYMEYNISVLDNVTLGTGLLKIFLVEDGLNVIVNITSITDVNQQDGTIDYDLKNLRKIKPKNIDIKDRISSLDFRDEVPTKVASKKQVKPFNIMDILDMESRELANEEQLQLGFLSDQENTLDLKSFSSDISNELVKVSSKVKNMSSEEAYDKVIDAEKSWRDNDASRVDADAENLADKWYGREAVLFDSFASIDKVREAIDIFDRISSLDNKIYSSKKKSEKDKFLKEKDELEEKINEIVPTLPSHMTKNYNITSQAERMSEIENKYEEYLSDFELLSERWNSLISNIKKQKKNIELVDQLSATYLKGKYNSLMPMYEKLISIDPPNLFSQCIESPMLMRSVFSKVQSNFRKALDTFGRVYMRILEDLEESTGSKAFQKSLF